jgi:PadR family transcriptional regulator, regulatory protein PadR
VRYLPIAIAKPRLKAQPLLPFLILHLLDAEADNGYGLMRRIDELTLGLMSVNPNMIYPLLNRLEEQNFISGEWIRPTPQRQSHAYRITVAGKAQLDKMRPKALQEMRTLLKSVERLYSECQKGRPMAWDDNLISLTHKDRRQKYLRMGF